MFGSWFEYLDEVAGSAGEVSEADRKAAEARRAHDRAEQKRMEDKARAYAEAEALKRAKSGLGLSSELHRRLVKHHGPSAEQHLEEANEMLGAVRCEQAFKAIVSAERAASVYATHRVSANDGLPFDLDSRLGRVEAKFKATCLSPAVMNGVRRKRRRSR